MSNPPGNGTPANTFIAMCTFKSDSVMAEVMAVVAEERAHVSHLQAQGELGTVHLAIPRNTVFLEVFAPDASEAQRVVLSLPMARWWDIELYPVVPPAPLPQD